MDYAGFWLRVCAQIIDIIVLSFAVVLFRIFYQFLFIPTLPFSFYSTPVNFRFLSIIIPACYYAFMESSAWQATLGKRAMGLAVIDMDGQRISFIRSLCRYFAKFISSFILCLGFVMVAFTDKKQGLHDKIVETLVINKKG